MYMYIVKNYIESECFNYKFYFIVCIDVGFLVGNIILILFRIFK